MSNNFLNLKNDFISFLDYLTTLPPAVIGSLLTILGGVIGALITHKLTASKERGKLRVEKAEMIARLSYSYLKWVNDQYNNRLIENKNFDSNDPSMEMTILVNLYFPDLLEKLNDMRELGTKCVHWSMHTSIYSKDNPTKSIVEIDMRSYDKWFYDLALKRTKFVSLLGRKIKRYI